MKVVLFCGGLGTRLKEHSETVPKPMVEIGYRPILWHLMKYYAHHGFTDFILCLGYRGDSIKNYFLHYDECVSNDFVMSQGGRRIELTNSDIDQWTITFAESGLHSNLAQRLRCVRKYLKDEEVFLANYTDGLSDVPIREYLDYFRRQDKIASFVAVRPSQSFHVVAVNEDGTVSGIEAASKANVWINGGFFIFRREIFDYLRDGEDLAPETFRRLASDGQLTAYRYEGFWACMDTLKEKQHLDALYQAGTLPWAVWEKEGRARAVAVPRPAEPTSVLRPRRPAVVGA